MRGSRKFCQRGSKCDVFFCLFFDERREDLNTTVRWPLPMEALKLNAGLVGL